MVCNEIRVDEDAAHIMRRILVDIGVSCRLGVALGRADDTAEQLIGRALLTATEAVEAA